MVCLGGLSSGNFGIPRIGVGEVVELVIGRFNCYITAVKRMHLFEFEDLLWFPSWLRILMTRYINTIHKLLGSSQQIAELLSKFLAYTSERHILDLCSGSGGPMPEVKYMLQGKHGIDNLTLTLSDLYPNLSMAEVIDQQGDDRVSYRREPINAVNLGAEP